MCICFCMHPYECMHYASCNLHISLCMSKFINNISWLFPSKMTPHKAQFAFVFYASIWVHALCIIQLTYWILHNVYSLIILVDFSHRKWHPTRSNVYFFLDASIWVQTFNYALCNFNILHFAWVNSVIILVDFSYRQWHPTQGGIKFFASWEDLFWAKNVARNLEDSICNLSNSLL